MEKHEHATIKTLSERITWHKQIVDATKTKIDNEEAKLERSLRSRFTAERQLVDILCDMAKCKFGDLEKQVFLVQDDVYIFRFNHHGEGNLERVEPIVLTEEQFHDDPF